MTEPPPIDPAMIPTDAFERRSWINTQLRLRGIKQPVLAETLGCSRQTVSQCLTAPKSERIEAAVADALGLTPRQLFPERYAADGSRLYRSASASRAA